MVDNGAAGDVYTGLEIAQNSHGQNVLYAADFTKNRVEMFSGDFKRHRLLHRSDRDEH